MKRTLCVVLALILLSAGSAFAAWPDNEQLGTKLNAAGIAYAAYWADPGASPTAAQFALAKEYTAGMPTVGRFLTIYAQLSGLSDASNYATVKAWLDARESMLIKLFGFGG